MANFEARNSVAHSRAGRRFGLSVAAAILAGTALAPAGGQVADLGGNLVATNDFLTFNPAIAGAPFSVISNGTLRAIINGSNAIGFGGNLNDSLGLLSLRKEGTGTLTLSGNNTFGGGTLVLNGTLIAGSATALSGASLLSLNGVAGSTATLDMNGFNGSAAGLIGNLRGILTSTNGPAVLTIDSDLNRTFSGSLQGAVGITKRGIGLQSFTMLDPIGNASNATGRRHPCGRRERLGQRHHDGDRRVELWQCAGGAGCIRQ
jgi:fibronectin-binding autotransporter adhesin